MNKNTKTTIIILSSLVALIGIGIATGFITFNPIDKSKPSYAKDQQCFEELKAKLTPDEMMEIIMPFVQAKADAERMAEDGLQASKAIDDLIKGLDDPSKMN